MSPLFAFELTPDIPAETLQGATISFGPNTQTLDIKAALDAGEGTIVSDDPYVISTLAAFPALQACDVPPEAAVTPLAVTSVTPTEPDPVLYTPQESPALVAPLSPPVEEPASVEPTDPDPAAVHPPEPSTPDEAAQQPASQRARKTNPTTPAA